jgi:hypothetical protein
VGRRGVAVVGLAGRGGIGRKAVRGPGGRLAVRLLRPHVRGLMLGGGGRRGGGGDGLDLFNRLRRGPRGRKKGKVSIYTP